MHVFDKALPVANLWVKEMMAELATDNADKAHHALRAGLHALRDRLTVDGAAHLSAQLPLLIRGLFFEGWDPSDKPLRIRQDTEFLDLVLQRYAPRTDAVPQEITRAVFSVLRRHTTPGEVQKVVTSLPHELVALANAARS